MKKAPLFIFLLLAIFSCKNTFSQRIEKGDSLGLPGDNLNLYAVLDLFQKSATFEEFEKQLNQEDSKINNLDLNNDDKTDYIKVIDHQTGESHAVVMQVPVNEKETQDVAVIEIDKDKNGKVIVQIVGNEELYGKDYIVEPAENDPAAKSAIANKKSDTTYSADGKTVIINNTTNNYNTTNNATTNSGGSDYVAVSYWPIVHYVYAPAYVVYVSPWHWYYYPSWWRPWSPWYWHSYYWHHRNHYYHNHYGWYHRTNYYRSTAAHNYYGPYRSTSATVQNHRKADVYSRTYASKSRAGDGKIKPGVANPAFNNNKGDNRADNKFDNKGDNRAGDKPDNKFDNNNKGGKGDKTELPKSGRKDKGDVAKPKPNNGNNSSAKPKGNSGSGGRMMGSGPRISKPSAGPKGGGGSSGKRGGGGRGGR